MNLNIETLNKLTEEHYKLLLEADPNEKLISKYLNRSFCFEATYNNELLGVLILLPTHPETLEVVNIAVISTQRNKGIGHQLLTFAEKYARNNNYKCLEIGTGTTSFGQLYLYQKCDFRVVGVDQNFFIIHYDKEITENGLVLRDMIRLRKVLK